MAFLKHPPQTCLGCDVAKREIVIALNGTVTSIANQARSIRTFLANTQACLLVCEPTGGHEHTLIAEAVRLGIPVHRADTLKVKAFIRSYGTLGKSDAIDARALALYGVERGQRLSLWQPAGQTSVQLQAMVRRRNDLVAMKVAEQNRAKAPGARAISASCSAMLAAIIRQIKAIEAAIDKLVASCRQLSRKGEICTQMEGIGKRTATAILAIMPEIGSLTRRQVASLAGLAPHPNESGETARRRNMRGGRPELARALFMPALRAAQGKGEFAAFYKRLVNAGKKPIVAIAAVMRKIIVVLNARIRDAQIPQS